MNPGIVSPNGGTAMTEQYNLQEHNIRSEHTKCCGGHSLDLKFSPNFKFVSLFKQIISNLACILVCSS